MKSRFAPLSAEPLRFLPLSEDGAGVRGRFEIHYTEAWPEAESAGLEKCDEHGDTCAKKVTYMSAPIVRKVIMKRGPFLDLG